MHGATLWIVAAIACRLAGPDHEAQPGPAPVAAAPAPYNPLAHARRIAAGKGFR
jgi:hypothetical protein